MRKALNSVGYEVPAIVSSGEDAIKVSEEIKPDLSYNGYQVGRRNGWY